MNRLVSLAKLTKTKKTFPLSSRISVIVNSKRTPLGFVFGRDSFIAFLEKIDEEFEAKVKDPKQAYNNLAGRLIDLIEEKLPVNPKFVKDLKTSISDAKKTRWIPLEEIKHSLNV